MRTQSTKVIAAHVNHLSLESCRVVLDTLASTSMGTTEKNIASLANVFLGKLWTPLQRVIDDATATQGGLEACLVELYGIEYMENGKFKNSNFKTAVTARMTSLQPTPATDATNALLSSMADMRIGDSK